MIGAAVVLLSLQATTSWGPAQAAPAPPVQLPTWGFARPPQRLHPIASLFTVDDYPAAARGTGAAGTVTIRLTIDPAGRIAGCRIVQSSGYFTLDRATCMIAQRRARYGPALDANGRPTTGTIDEDVTWQTR